MKKMHAQWLTVHKADIDQETSIEILWQTAPNTLQLLIFRISNGSPGTRPRLATEEIGPYHCLAELRQQLCMLFGDLAARRICHPSSWLPPGIPATPPVPLRLSPSVTQPADPRERHKPTREYPALTTAHSSHLAMTEVQPSEKVHQVPSREHWTKLA
jgi:hypothetical protein